MSSAPRATRGPAPSRSRTVRAYRGAASGSPGCLGSWFANRCGRKTHVKPAADAVRSGPARERRLMTGADWNGGEAEPPVGRHHDPENRGQARPRIVLQEHEVTERLYDRLAPVPHHRLQHIGGVGEDQVRARVPQAARQVDPKSTRLNS